MTATCVCVNICTRSFCIHMFINEWIHVYKCFSQTKSMLQGVQAQKCTCGEEDAWHPCWVERQQYRPSVAVPSICCSTVHLLQYRPSIEAPRLEMVEYVVRWHLPIVSTRYLSARNHTNVLPCISTKSRLVKIAQIHVCHISELKNRILKSLCTKQSLDLATGKLI